MSDIPGWKPVQVPWPLRGKDGLNRGQRVYLHQGKPVEPNPHLDANPCGWGWLAADKMGEDGDLWVFHFRAEYGRASWWGEALCPPTWEGKLHSEHVGMMLGITRVGDSDWEKWLAPVSKCETPELPGLGEGESRLDVPSEERVLLGVLRLMQQTRNGFELMVAYGRPNGEFLGWEWILGMDEIHNRDEKETVDVNSCAGWENFEKVIRADVWGREL